VQLFIFVPQTNADTVTDKAFSYLRAKQDATGKITTGYSAPSQWSAIAFAANGIDISSVKSSGKSLLEFLLTDIPPNEAATDYETRILAIVATGGNPTNFNGVNYVSHLEGFYKEGQLGDSCLLNDDIYGLLALVASGSTSTDQVKQGVLHFLISKQDPTDGGFGYYAPGCSDWYSPSSDMTGSAIQALISAKNAGLTDAELDTSIDRAKAYLLANKDADGGFGYYGSSDSDSTALVLQAFNVLGMQESSEAINARAYLLSQQSDADGGFLSYGATNATTTAQSIIALSGKGLVIKIYDPATQPSISPTILFTPTPTQTVTPTPTTALSGATANAVIPTPTIIPTQTPTSTPESTISSNDFLNDLPITTDQLLSGNEKKATPTAIIQSSVLGTAEKKTIIAKPKENGHISPFVSIFSGLGVFFLFLSFAKRFIIRQVQ
jgi:hypothetical protein